MKDSETTPTAAPRYANLPFVPGISLPQADKIYQPAPSPEECFRLWDRYAMPPHIRAHSSQVALVLSVLGDLAIARGAVLSRSILLAGGLLHDIAKIYTSRYPGDHAQIGAALTLRETGNYLLSQMVFHHVGWPWETDVHNDRILHVLLTGYADKRVMHDRIVTLEERFADLNVRYGKSERSRTMLAWAHQQTLEIETALSRRLGVNINEYKFCQE